MPKTAYFSMDSDREGIDIKWTPSTQRLLIGGWYDGMVGIQGTELTLKEFFDKLGITEEQCRKAFRGKQR